MSSIEGIKLILNIYYEKQLKDIKILSKFFHSKYLPIKVYMYKLILRFTGYSTVPNHIPGGQDKLLHLLDGTLVAWVRESLWAGLLGGKL